MSLLVGLLVIVGIIVFILVGAAENDRTKRTCPSCGLTTVSEYQRVGAMRLLRCRECGTEYKKHGDGPMIRA